MHQEPVLARYEGSFKSPGVGKPGRWKAAAQASANTTDVGNNGSGLYSYERCEWFSGVFKVFLVSYLFLVRRWRFDRGCISKSVGRKED